MLCKSSTDCIAFFIFDELYSQTNRELFDVMTKGSRDARTQPLFFLITTAGTNRHSVCFEQHQKVEDDADLTSEEVWYRANPSLGHTIDIGKVRSVCLSARDNPAEENIFSRPGTIRRGMCSCRIFGYRRRTWRGGCGVTMCRMMCGRSRGFWRLRRGM